MPNIVILQIKIVDYKNILLMPIKSNCRLMISDANILPSWYSIEVLQFFEDEEEEEKEGNFNQRFSPETYD